MIFYPRELVTLGIHPWGDFMFGIFAIAMIAAAIYLLNGVSTGEDIRLGDSIRFYAGLIFAAVGIPSVLGWVVFSGSDLITTMGE